MLTDMNKFITTLSFLLLLFAPTISAQNSNNGRVIESATHVSGDCADEMRCVKAQHQCCVSQASVSFYFETLPMQVGFNIFHRAAYISYNQPILSGVQSVFYRPPIL